MQVILDDALGFESQREQSISHKDEFLTSDGIQLFVQGNILMDSGVSFQVFRSIDSCDTPADPFSALEGNSKYFFALFGRTAKTQVASLGSRSSKSLKTRISENPVSSCVRTEVWVEYMRYHENIVLNARVLWYICYRAR